MLRSLCNHSSSMLCLSSTPPSYWKELLKSVKGTCAHPLSDIFWAVPQAPWPLRHYPGHTPTLRDRGHLPARKVELLLGRAEKVLQSITRNALDTISKTPTCALGPMGLLLSLSINSSGLRCCECSSQLHGWHAPYLACCLAYTYLKGGWKGSEKSKGYTEVIYKIWPP